MGSLGDHHQTSTRSLRSDERIEFWEDHISQVLLDIGVRSLDSRPFEAAERSVRLPHLTFAQIATNPHVLERTEKHCATSPSDGVMLFFMVGGEGFFHHREGTQLQRAGMVLLCDANQPFLRGFTGSLREYVLTVPQETYEQIVRHDSARPPMLMDISDPHGPGAHGAELARLMRDSLSQTSALDAAEVEQSAIDMLGAMLSTEGRNSAAARRREATAWIRRHLHDSSLSVTTVAHATGMSERTLTRAFGETGAGVARTILELRLAKAHELLTQQRTAPVHELAESCGFVSAAHFSRVFRDRYGATPVDVQQRGASAAG